MDKSKPLAGETRPTPACRVLMWERFDEAIDMA